MKSENSLGVHAVQLFFLAGFAIAQPLFDLLSRQAVFFVARNTSPQDILLLTWMLSFLPWLLLVLCEVLVGLFGKRPRKVLHQIFVFALVTLIGLPVLKRAGLPDGLLIVVAMAMSSVVTVGSARSSWVRDPWLLSLASIIVLLFPGLFLFHSPVSKILITQRQVTGEVTANANADIPVIFVVFDEFTAISLMNEERQIDSVRYPNFAAFAAESTWYRNATTNAAFTETALPAILTGKRPPAQLLPMFSDHPENLFTLLRNTHDLYVREAVTQLCPPSLCKDDSGEREADDIFSLGEDLVIVYLHLILPRSAASTLPPIHQGWKSFRTGQIDETAETPPAQKRRAGDPAVSRGAKFSSFVQSIQPADRPALYFLHMVLPHAPYHYLPSGKQYWTHSILRDQASPGHWKDDERAVRVAQQRYLLQVGFVDRLVGELVAQLRTTDFYDRALIVLMADHGVSFQSGDKHRGVTSTNYQDIMSIPLFIKSPHQRAGRIDDRNVETIDILPTIADILGISLPWQVEGASVRSPGSPERREKHIMSGGEEFTYEPSLRAKYNSLRRWLELFGAESWEGLYTFGPHGDLIGTEISGTSISGDLVSSDHPSSVEVEDYELFQNIDIELDFVPAQVRGRIRSETGRAPMSLAIGLNGTIRAITESYQKEDSHRFSAFLPDWAFRSGFNDLQIFTVEELPGRQRRLNPTISRVGEYRLFRQKNGRETLMTPEGKAIPLLAVSPKSRLVCYLASVPTPDVAPARFAGWAVDVKNRRPPEEIVIFVNGKVISASRPNRRRPDLVKRFGSDQLLLSGFSLAVPLAFSDDGETEIRIFAVLKTGIASEFQYPVGYSWLRRFKLRAVKGKGEFLESHDGEPIPILSAALRGHFSRKKRGGQPVLVGWAADVENMETPSDIVVFLNDEFFHAASPDLRRPIIVKTFGSEKLLWSGFRFPFPEDDFRDFKNSTIRVFAVSRRGVATELGSRLPEVP